MSRISMVFACALLLWACTTSQRWQLGVPGTQFDFVVTRLEERGQLIDVWLQRDELRLRSFVPDSPDCRALLEPEQTVTWHQGGSGVFRRGELECRAAGIGTLEEWRDRLRATPDLRDAPVPRAQADYRIVYEDEEVAFLRGRFPLANRIGWTGLSDTIAVVSKDSEPCADVLARDVATLEYYPRGTPVLALLGAEARCPIVGLVRPPGAEARAERPGADAR